MPAIFRHGPYRFFFYSSDCDEPAHVHIEREDKVAKFWLEPVRLAHSGGYGRAEIARLERLVMEHRETLKEAWDAYCRGA